MHKQQDAKKVENNGNRGNIVFQKLTPTNEIDISTYEEAIDYVFENNDITNIAVSGPYSAGKSSVIEAYKKKNAEKKFMHISLAHFQNEDEENETKEAVLEGKILNQLIHQIPVESIPQTNFRIKRDSGKKKTRAITILITLLILSGLYVFKSEKIILFIDSLNDSKIKNILSMIICKEGVIIASIVFLSCLIICIFSAVKIQQEKKLFHKISFKGNEIEIFEQQDESYFDKYLNEVLYLFEKVDVDVIVFEDLDRFNVNGIFERLREINNLVNIQRLNKSDNSDDYKPIRFMYLIKDDVFVTKDRTKFFDYIVPIVPVLDGSNSYEQFVKYFKKAEFIERIDENFLQRLSLYIDDMRILKNIYNEFTIYINRINNTDLNWNKMLSMIVYKNIFPRDFSDLQLGKGYVYELFQKKEDIIIAAEQQLNEEKKIIIDDIDILKKERLKSKEEIEDAYEAKYKRLPRNLYNSGKLSTESEAMWTEMLKEKEKRLEGIDDPDYLVELENRLAEIERNLSFLKSRKLSELITRENSESVYLIEYVNPIGEKEEFRSIKANDYFDLLKFLISNGFIDETYSDYMSYFYEGSLSVNDKMFLRRITDRRGADFEYELKDVNKVLNSPILRVVDFSEEETQNFELISGLIKAQKDKIKQEYLQVFLEQLKQKKCISFISQFYNSDAFNKQFIDELNKWWPEFFSYAYRNKALSIEQTRQYSYDTLMLSKPETLLSVNKDNVFSMYITKSDDYLDIKTDNPLKIIDGLKLLNISFEKISFEKSDKQLFDAIYAESMYDFSFDNIKLMLLVKYQIEDNDDILHKNYSLIMQNEDSSLRYYVEQNFAEYMQILIENCGEYIEDNETVALSILNSDLIDLNQKKKYILLSKTKIESIKDVADNELWSTLIENNEVQGSIYNVMEYFNVFGMTEILIDYLNRNADKLDFSDIEPEYGEEVSSNLFKKILISEMLSNEIYEKILWELNFTTSQVSDGITNNKVKILIESEILEMNEKTLNTIRDLYPELVNIFIGKNIEKYIEIQNTITPTQDEIIYVLDLPIDDERKINLLNYVRYPISILGKEYSDTLKSFILNNNLDENDLEKCFVDYQEYGPEMRDSIYRIATEKIDEIIEDKMQINDALLSDIIKKSTFSKERKIDLWGVLLPYSNEEECKTHFDELDLPELKGIFTKRNSNKTYEKNNNVAAILDILKSNTWIYDYSISAEDTEKYIVTKNPPKGTISDFLD